MQGYISYPRTESSAYPPNFDLHATLEAQRKHPVWGDYTRAIQAMNLPRPKGGTDVGDHPPITPVRAAPEAELGACVRCAGRVSGPLHCVCALQCSNQQ